MNVEILSDKSLHPSSVIELLLLIDKLKICIKINLLISVKFRFIKFEFNYKNLKIFTYNL